MLTTLVEAPAGAPLTVKLRGPTGPTDFRYKGNLATSPWRTVWVGSAWKVTRRVTAEATPPDEKIYTLMKAIIVATINPLRRPGRVGKVSLDARLILSCQRDTHDVAALNLNAAIRKARWTLVPAGVDRVAI